MKTTTLLAIAVISLLVILEESSGKITVLHNFRVSGKATRKQSRRRPLVKRPKNSTRVERNHPKRTDERLTRVRNVFCFMQDLFLLCSCLPETTPYKKKKYICIFLLFLEIQQMARVSKLDE